MSDFTWTVVGSIFAATSMNFNSKIPGLRSMHPDIFHQAHI